MIARKTKYFDLPLRMTKREYVKRDGSLSIRYFYECPRDKNGKKKLIPLGGDLPAAKIKWAELEGKPAVAQNSIEAIHDRYWRWVERESELKPRTRENYLACWKMLKPVFSKMNIDRVKPAHLLRYHSSRSSKIRAKLEIRYLSTFFNWARLHGLMTIPNPVTGITRQLSGNSRRNIYVTDEDFALVFRFADQTLKDAMRIAFLTGQRPGDVLKMKWSDIADNVLTVRQSKTGQFVRIEVIGELKNVLDEIRKRPIVGNTLVCNRRGQQVTQKSMQKIFRKARNSAVAFAEANDIEFQPFQFRDLRAKAASDSDTDDTAKNLLGHRQITTTAIYRRDKKLSVQPVMSKKFLDMDEKHSKRKINN